MQGLYLWSLSDNSAPETQWNGETFTLFSTWFCSQLHQCLPKTTTRKKREKWNGEPFTVIQISCDTSCFLMSSILQREEQLLCFTDGGTETHGNLAATLRSCYKQWQKPGQAKVQPSRSQRLPASHPALSKEGALSPALSATAPETPWWQWPPVGNGDRAFAFPGQRPCCRAQHMGCRRPGCCWSCSGGIAGKTALHHY